MNITNGVVSAQCSHKLRFDGFHPLVKVKILIMVRIRESRVVAVSAGGTHRDSLSREKIDL